MKLENAIIIALIIIILIVAGAFLLMKSNGNTQDPQSTMNITNSAKNITASDVDNQTPMATNDMNSNNVPTETQSGQDSQSDSPNEPVQDTGISAPDSSDSTQYTDDSQTDTDTSSDDTSDSQVETDSQTETDSQDSTVSENSAGQSEDTYDPTDFD